MARVPRAIVVAASFVAVRGTIYPLGLGQRIVIGMRRTYGFLLSVSE